MLISFLPAADHTVASSRIRVYAIQPALQRMGVRTKIGFCSTADILLVQKRLTVDNLELARTFRSLGRLVIYDCEDLGAALAYWAKEDLVHAMFQIANVVTTNTEEFRKEFIKSLNAKTVEIVPDAVDYYLESPVAGAGSTSSTLRLLWFGHHANIKLLLPYFSLFETMPDCSLTVCTGERGRCLVAPYQHVRFVPWSVREFPSVLRAFDLTFLPHGGTVAGRAKSSNRMITSIAWGVPAIVSRTPAYEETARSAGVLESCFGSVEEARKCIEALRPTYSRNLYLKKAQPVIWRKHSPDAVATRLCEVIANFAVPPRNDSLMRES
jgi:hypothetical protein